MALYWYIYIIIYNCVYIYIHICGIYGVYVYIYIYILYTWYGVYNMSIIYIYIYMNITMWVWSKTLYYRKHTSWLWQHARREITISDILGYPVVRQTHTWKWTSPISMPGTNIWVFLIYGSTNVYSPVIKHGLLRKRNILIPWFSQL